ncbi:hypothetical protein C8R46DRAFT_127870 [Mycena filopes]|nr:hypothetical protein C8R46DRAFT_127870 [Mycena filopes]
MGIALLAEVRVGRAPRSPMLGFLAVIRDVVYGVVIYLFHALCTRLPRRRRTPYASDLDHKTPLLLDCEKGYNEDDYMHQSRTQLLAALKRRDASDAAFEAEVAALLAPVKQRLAEISGDRARAQLAPQTYHRYDHHAPAPSPAYAPDLPPAPQLFYGHASELAALVSAFTAPSPPPPCKGGVAMTLTGPPGIGTSTLALALLHRAEVVRAFGARRFFVRCDRNYVGDGDGDVGAALAAALGLTRTPADPDPVAVLAACPLRTLLVLDDVQDADAPLLRALRCLPRVALLLTMRTGRLASDSSDTHTAMTMTMTLGPLPLPAARALFRAIADLPSVPSPHVHPPLYSPYSSPFAPAVDPSPTGADANPATNADVETALIDALLLHPRCACHPRAVVELARRAQYEPLPFLLAGFLEDEEEEADGDGEDAP